MVGFKWRMLVVSFRWSTRATEYTGRTTVEMEDSGGLRTENDSGELQMENYSNGL